MLQSLTSVHISRTGVLQAAQPATAIEKVIVKNIISNKWYTSNSTKMCLIPCGERYRDVEKRVCVPIRGPIRAVENRTQEAKKNGELGSGVRAAGRANPADDGARGRRTPSAHRAGGGEGQPRSRCEQRECIAIEANVFTLTLFTEEVNSKSKQAGVEMFTSDSSGMNI